MPDNRLITRDELLLRVPYTIQHIYRMEKAGKFPRRVRLSANRVAWVMAEVAEWVQTRIDNRVGQVVRL